jgi:hypothetical protein
VPGGADTDVQFNDGGAFGGDAKFLYDKTVGQVAIGSSSGLGGGALWGATPPVILDVESLITVDTGIAIGIVDYIKVNYGAPSGSTVIGLAGVANNVTANVVDTLEGAFFSATGNATTEVSGMNGSGTFTGAGSVAAVRGVNGTATNGAAGTVVDAVVFDADAIVNSGGGSITNAYGLRVGNINTATNNWAIKTGAGKVQFGDQLVLDKDALLNPTPADQSYSGLTATLTYGEALTPGTPVYYKSDEKVYRADATTQATCPCIGIALETAAGGTHLVLLKGFYRDDALFAWATVGGNIYVSATVGTLTQTMPIATDNVIQVVGVATDAKRMYVNPSPDYVTHT